MLDAHVREERVVLEHHADIAFIRRKPIDRFAGEGDHALARPFEASQHVQGRGLAGAGRPQECQEFAAPDRQVQPFDGLEVAIHFFDVDEFDKRFVAASLVLGRLGGSARHRSIRLLAFSASSPAPSGPLYDGEAMLGPPTEPVRADEFCVVETIAAPRDRLVALTSISYII